MNKQDFLDSLRKSLNGLPQEDIDERISFYGEMTDDRMEDGLSEEEAILQIGSVEKITEQIISETPISKLVKEKIKPNERIKIWEIILLILGSPIWFSLLVVLLAVVLSIYVSLWAVIISLWAVFASITGCAVGGVLSGTAFALEGNYFTGIAAIGAGILCAGLSIFAFFGCASATKGIVILTKKTAIRIKKLFIKKEVAQ